MSDFTPQQPTADEFKDPLANYEPFVYEDPLERAIGEEPVGTIRHEPFTTIMPSTPIRVAVDLLAGLEIACLMVTDEDNHLLGVFTHRDVLDKVALNFDNLQESPLSDVMTTEAISVHESDSVAAALCVMAVGGYRHVPVLDENEQVVGIVGPQRLTEFLQEKFQQLA